MAYDLRDYQIEAKTLAVEYFRTGDAKKRPMQILPTAAGKSVIIGYTAKELDSTILVLQPSKELLEQNYAKYQEAIKEHPDMVPASIYSASVGIKERGRVTFAMIGSIYRKPELFADVEHVIIDECHKVPPEKDSMYIQFLDTLPHAKVLGLTATPYRLKQYTDPDTYQPYSQINLLNRERPMFFNQFQLIVQPKEMQDRGFTAPIRYISSYFDGGSLKFNSTGAEFTDRSVKEAIERNHITDRIPAILEQAFRKGRKSCLVFVRSVAEAQHLASITPFADFVCAETKPKDRKRIIDNFRAGNIKTLYNVAVLTTGFDYPALDTIIIARPTMSLALYVQMIGRGIRLAPGKEYCSVLDMCGNLARFGKVEELRIEKDPIFGWVLRNDKQIISGRPLHELA